MPEQVRIWEITSDDQLKPIKQTRLDIEARIEEWLKKDISILSTDLLVIGQQVETISGPLDLLCVDSKGDLVVVELKRHKTPRDVTAQALDYASWVKNLTNEQIQEVANNYLKDKGPLKEAFKLKFGSDLEALNENHKVVIVASRIDERSERIINYLTDTYGVGINAATFEYFRDDQGRELLARAFLIEPEQAEIKTQISPASTHRSQRSREELQTIADQNGVGEIYKVLAAGMEQYFKRSVPKATLLGFVGRIGESQNAIFNLVPTASTPQGGLRFQVFFEKFVVFFGLDKSKALSILPPTKHEWQFSPGLEWSGYEGFFRNLGEANAFLEELRKINEHSTGN
jgi:Endonuclease NucS